MGVKSYQMELDMETKLVDAGVDYLRVTSDDDGEKRRLAEFYRRVRAGDHALGYEERTGGAFGFLGKKTRHALMGDKKEWSMLQVSGASAKRGWLIASERSQATRIDLQLTIWVGQEEVAAQIRNDYNAACAHVRSKARPCKVTMIESRHVPQTVYVGSRASDIFLREYDKYEESGKEEYKGCVRYELELKGRMAKALWQRWAVTTGGLRESLGMVLQMFAERGITIPCYDLDQQDVILLKKEQTTFEGTMAWLNRQVAPTVAKFSQTHGWISLFSSLFSDALTPWDQARIMKLLSIVWGT